MSGGETHPAHATIEAAARNSYGRLVAYLAARSHDVAGAEDALSEAFAAALQRWPVDGVPQKPEAWLLHSARNRMIDAARRHEVRQRIEPLLQIASEAESVSNMQPTFPDERLKLLFVCAHPAIDATARTPLMLQTVLGLDAACIASAFLVSPAAMEQRLVRAKNKIRVAGIPFVVPDRHEWDERAAFVLAAIYSAFNAGWENTVDDCETHRNLALEAITIARTLVELLPNEPEAHGLLALMLHSQARREARLSPAGDFISLDQQDTSLWSREMITEAEHHLRVAATYKKLGRFQLEAAIQSIHADRLSTGTVDWPQIALLYEGLIRLAPTIGAQVGRAVALAEMGNVTAGLGTIDSLPQNQTASYQPWWAARAHLLKKLNQRDAARKAYERAASLSEDPAIRTYLMKRAGE